MSRKTNDKSRFIPEPEKVWLGKGDGVKEYDVYPATWASLYKLKSVFRDLLSNVTDVWNSDVLVAVKEVASAEKENGSKLLQELAVNENIWKLLDELLVKPQEIFEIAIPNFDKSLFSEDNKDGATIPQVWATFEVIARVNDLEFAKNLLAGQLNPTTQK